MKCCEHETENESNKTEKENSEGHSGRLGHSGCCGGGGGGIVKWLFVGFIVSLLILFSRGMI